MVRTDTDGESPSLRGSAGSLSMVTAAIRVAFLGNFIERGSGLDAGASYAELVEESVRRRNQGVDVTFVHRVVPHPSLLAGAVDRVLADGIDVVVIGTFTNALQGSVALNPLWGTEGFRQIVSFVHAIDRRVVNDPFLRRRFGQLLRVNHPLRKKLPQLSIDAYRAHLEAAITRLQAGAVSVLLRGPMAISDRAGQRESMGQAKLYEEFSTRLGVPVVLGEEVLNGPVEAFFGEGGRMSAAGHRLYAQAFEGLVASAIQDSVHRRIAGSQGQLIR